MKKIIAYILLTVLLISTVGVPVTAYDATEDDSIAMGSHTIDSKLPVLGSEQLTTNARSVLLYEIGTDTLMYSWNADEKLPPASLAKILTALIAIERGDLASEVIVREDVLNTVSKNAVKSDLIVGEVLTLEELLYLMLVDSGNDAAAVLADHVAGSQEAFVGLMNEYAQSLGCTNSNFTDVHGIDDDNQYSTARDLGRILTAAVKNEVFADIFGTVYHTVPANNLSPKRSLISENYLISGDFVKIYFDGRVKGSRTGVMQDRTRSIASVAKANDLQLVCIILGSASVYEAGGVKVRSYGGYTETSDLLDLAFDGYQPRQLFYDGQVLKQELVENGDSFVSLGTKTSIATVLPAGITVDDLAVQYIHYEPQIRAPIQKGQLLSLVKYSYAGKCVAQMDLYAMNSVKAVDSGISTEQNDNKSSGWVIGVTVLVILILGIVLGFFGPKLYKRYFKKRRRSARRGN